MYKVYKLTSPNGKIYIGYTGEDNLNRRFQSGGNYKNNGALMADFEKYRWKNFEEEILGEYETAEEAQVAESFAIVFNKAYDPEIGYNIIIGKDTVRRLYTKGLWHKETDQFFSSYESAGEAMGITDNAIRIAVKQKRACKRGTFIPVYLDNRKGELVDRDMFEKLEVYWEQVKQIKLKNANK